MTDHHHHHHHPDAGVTTADPAHAGLPDGGSTIDPVCGMTVDPASAKHTSEHAGRHWFFCSAG